MNHIVTVQEAYFMYHNGSRAHIYSQKGKLHKCTPPNLSLFISIIIYLFGRTPLRDVHLMLKKYVSLADLFAFYFFSITTL